MKKYYFYLMTVTAFLLLIFCNTVQSQNWTPVGNKIKTQWGEALNTENVWNEYPRPQLVREEWQNLNGLWEYSLQPKQQAMPKRFQGHILVPFCVESSLSGVGKMLSPNDQIWYRKTFNIPTSWDSKTILLHFEAVDYETNVWINDILVGSHRGGYDRFSFDITPYLKQEGEQEIIVGVKDPTNMGTQARGKQQLNPSGIFYTPVSGIWQTVWLEAISGDAWISELRIIPDIDKQTVTILPFSNKPLESEALGWRKGRKAIYLVHITILKEGKEIAKASTMPDKSLTIRINNPKLWSPDQPFLYDLNMVLSDVNGEELDKVKSYFGMRKISLGLQNGHQVLMLNNKPLFHYGTLDQGWWPDGLYTAPSDEALQYDIEMTKKMGFNMIRKHVKIEPDRWYHHCDRLGIMVWQDMPSALVSASKKKKWPNIPNVGIWQALDFGQEDLFRRSVNTAQFEWELQRMIDIHFNAPSIVIWVPFNEGWGQYATHRVVNNIKAYDPTRLVNPTSGWSLRPSGDIYAIHSYDVKIAEPPTALDRASVLGEFGGIGYPIEQHLWNPKLDNWGYQTYTSTEDYLKHYKLKFEQVLNMKQQKGLSAAVYTQTTDVESEVNGLMTYDRKILKIPADTLKSLHSSLFK